MSFALENFTLERIPIPDKDGVIKEILGSIYRDADRELICKTMELPYRDNASSRDSSKASSIPEGTYLVEKNPPKESRPYGYFRIASVPGRSVNADGKSSILLHRITHVEDLLGCIGIGSRFMDIDKDGVLDMVESGKKLEWMYQNLPDKFILKIIKKPGL